MRRLAALFLFASAVAAAQPLNAGEEHPHAASPEHHAEEAAACEASSSDEQCLEYWEHHINWWSWDYKAGKDQLPEHRHMPGPFGFALINFGVFALIMSRLAGKPLKEFVRTRHITIKKDLDEAAAMRAQASAKLREYEEKIAGIDREIDTLVANVRREAEEDKARIIAAAAEQAKRLRADAEAQIQTEVERTKAQLRRELVDHAIAAAEAAVREKLGADDQTKMAARYVSELEAAPKVVKA